MKISTEIYSTAKIVGEQKAVEYIAKAGFDAWDFSMFKDLYDALFGLKDTVENEVGRSLIWDRKDSVKASSVSYELLNGFDIYDESRYDFYSEEIIGEINDHFYKFEKIIKNLK